MKHKKLSSNQIFKLILRLFHIQSQQIFTEASVQFPLMNEMHTLKRMNIIIKQKVKDIN